LLATLRSDTSSCSVNSGRGVTQEPGADVTSGTIDVCSLRGYRHGIPVNSKYWLLMKNLLVLLFTVSISAHAVEDCVFEENAFFKFRDEYVRQNKNAHVDAVREVLVVKKDNERIEVSGGGCVHLGALIRSRSDEKYTEVLFFRKVLELTQEFGAWLVNTDALAQSIELGKWQILDGEYYIQIDAMTVFAASFDEHGTVNVSLYIN